MDNFSKGMQLFNEGYPSNAVAFFGKEIEKNPQDSEAAIFMLCVSTISSERRVSDLCESDITSIGRLLEKAIAKNSEFCNAAKLLLVVIYHEYWEIQSCPRRETERADKYRESVFNISLSKKEKKILSKVNAVTEMGRLFLSAIK